MLALMSVLMSHTSLHFFVSSFVLGCAYACVASVNQALRNQPRLHDACAI